MQLFNNAIMRKQSDISIRPYRIVRLTEKLKTVYVRKRKLELPVLFINYQNLTQSLDTIIN